MSLILSHEDKTYEIIEAGNHPARCVQLIDLGTQLEKAFESDEIKEVPKIRITWELPNELIEWEDKDTGEKKSSARIISQEFKASLHEKSRLRQMLASWRGRDFTAEELKGFDLRNILDKACMLNITHVDKKDKTFANIASVTPMPKGMTCPDAVNEIINYDIADNMNGVFKKLPEFIQNKIKESVEVKGRADEELPEVDIDEYQQDHVKMPY